MDEDDYGESALSMTRRGFGKGLVGIAGALTLGYVLNKLPIAYANNPSSIMIGPGSEPTIDGVWDSGEWENDSVQLSYWNMLTKVNDKGKAFLRLKHNYDGKNLDVARLFGLYDGISDDGSTFPDSTGQNYGALTFNIDANNNGRVTDNNSDAILFLDANDGKNYGVGTLAGDTNIMAKALQAKMKIATTIGTSPNSIDKHRILEFSIPLKPVLNWSGNDFAWAPKDGNGNYVIGFGAWCQDSYDNQMSISHGDSLAVTQLTFGSIPVSEPGDVLLVGGLVVLAAASPQIYSRVKNRKLTRREFLHLPNKNNLPH